MLNLKNAVRSLRLCLNSSYLLHNCGSYNTESCEALLIWSQLCINCQIPFRPCLRGLSSTILMITTLDCSFQRFVQLRELRLGSSLKDHCDSNVSDDDEEDDPTAHDVALNSTFDKLCSLSLHGSLCLNMKRSMTVRRLSAVSKTSRHLYRNKASIITLSLIMPTFFCTHPFVPSA